MKKILFILPLVLLLSSQFVNAQSRTQTEALISVPVGGKHYVTITTKSNIKDLNVNSITINNLNNDYTKSQLGAQYDYIIKSLSSPSSSLLLDIINAFASQRFYVVSSSIANSGDNIITSYLLCVDPS